ncbi:dipeptidase PepE [soil metagenome]
MDHPAAPRRILLLSTSTVFGGGYLDYAQAEIGTFLEGVSTILFIPFALHDHAAYAAKVQVAFTRMSIAVESLHTAADKPGAVRAAEAIFIGGGNTFRLLKALHEHHLLGAIRERVNAGMRYMGSSAGSNVAAPTIRTTNDMPIVEPPSFLALGLVPFQINPHYLDPVPGSTHMGETREERLLQFLEENRTPVLALREGAMLQIEDHSCVLRGTAGARLFRRGNEPEELAAGAALDHLLAGSA